MGKNWSAAVEFMVFWYPGILRGFILCAIAVLTMLMSQMENLTEEKVAAMGWVGWVKFSVPLLLTALITAKGFLDDTMGKLREKHDTGFFVKPDSR